MQFPTTQWTHLAQASLNGDSAARAALDRLCEQYREPVRVFLLKRGHSEPDANDLTQEFLAELIRSKAWQQADQARGRFRTFLLGMLMHVVSRKRERECADKRGGGHSDVSLEVAVMGGREPAHPPPDSAVFDREWGLRVMDMAMEATENALAADGVSAERWPVLASFLPGAGVPPSYEDAARQLGLTVPAVKTAVHRVRQRLREELRGIVARTVNAAHEIDDELAYLHRVLASPNV